MRPWYYCNHSCKALLNQKIGMTLHSASKTTCNGSRKLLSMIKGADHYFLESKGTDHYFLEEQGYRPLLSGEQGSRPLLSRSKGTDHYLLEEQGCYFLGEQGYRPLFSRRARKQTTISRRERLKATTFWEHHAGRHPHLCLTLKPLMSH